MQMVLWDEPNRGPRAYEKHLASLEELDFYRADQDCICSLCGKRYGDHPEAKEFRSWAGHNWLNRLCNGDLVKL